MQKFFTNRQLNALNVFSDLVKEVKDEIIKNGQFRNEGNLKEN
jgi:hypothetical protein